MLTGYRTRTAISARGLILDFEMTVACADSKPRNRFAHWTVALLGRPAAAISYYDTNKSIITGASHVDSYRGGRSGRSCDADLLEHDAEPLGMALHPRQEKAHRSPEFLFFFRALSNLFPQASLE
jgi:hypothetical protein